MSRLDMIQKTLKREAMEKMEAERKYNQESERMLSKISELRPRIVELLELGNALEGIGRLNVKRPGENYTWYTDSFYHRVGFIRNKNGITKVGFYNGGACGPWDFYTNGIETISVNGDSRKTPSNKDLKWFLTGFEEFESEFYAWFDKEFGEKKEDAQ